jgi:hypothetical protein
LNYWEWLAWNRRDVMDFPSEWTGKNFSDCDKIRPMNLSKITRNVFRGDTPRADQYDSLRDLGVRLVINMGF